MSGAINTKILVQHMQGNIATSPPSVPARVWTSPGACIWDAGSGSTGTIGPTVWNAFPGPPGWENNSSDLLWRAFHRCIRAPNSIDGTIFYAYHRNVIYGLTAPPNWTVVHTCTNQRTDSASRDGGDHTGLYPVHSLNRDKLWYVGLYRTTSDTIGFVKFDSLNNVWSSANTGLGSHNLPFSVCAEWNGKLAHAGSSGLLLFDPKTDNLEVISYTGNSRDWIWVQNGRLFIITKQSGNISVFEFVAGGLLDHGTVTGGNENTSNEGGWSVFSFTDNVFYITYYTTVGGNGWRMEKVAVGSTTPGALDLTFSDLTSPVIPNSTYGIGNQAGILRWPSGTDSRDRQQFFASPDNAEWPRGAFGTSGGVFAALQLQCPPIAGVTKYQGAFHNLIWNGEGSEITLGKFPDEWCDQTGHYSFPVSRYGRGDNDFNGSGSWIESIAAYNDNTVSRGLLLKFRLHEPNGGAKDWQGQYGSPIGQVVGPGFNAMSLSLGDGIDPGGTATLNSLDNTLDELVGSFFDGSFPQAILNHDMPSVGSGFIVGETVTGSVTGCTGTVIAVRGAPTYRIGIQQTSAPATEPEFNSSDIITGSASGTIAQLNANQDNDPLYQIIWDLDEDNISDLVYAELSTVTIPTGTIRPTGNTGTYIVGPTQVALIPESTEVQSMLFNGSSEVEEPVVITTSAPSIVASETEEPVVLGDVAPLVTASETEEPVALSDIANSSNFSEVETTLTATNNIPQIATEVTERPFVQPGGLIGFQFDGTEIGVRTGVNFVSNTLLNQPLDFQLELPGGPGIIQQITNSTSEIGRTSIDALNDNFGSINLISDLVADGYDNVIIDFIAVLATNVSAVTTQPSISVGTNVDITAELSYDDQIETTELTLTSTNQCQDIIAVTPNKMAKASNLDVIFVQLDKLAVATTYQVDVIVYGKIVLS